jgi:hypothetical protein
LQELSQGYSHPNPRTKAKHLEPNYRVPVELKKLEEPQIIISNSQKSICTRCVTAFPDSVVYFPLLDTRLELLRELGIEPYQCANCIRKGVARSEPPRPIYGDNVVRYIADMKAGVAIAYLTALVLSFLSWLFVLLIGWHSWQGAGIIGCVVFIVVITVEAVLYLLD